MRAMTNFYIYQIAISGGGEGELGAVEFGRRGVWAPWSLGAVEFGRRGGDDWKESKKKKSEGMVDKEKTKRVDS
jgi:hypothetical protein